MRIRIITIGSEGDVRPYVALGVGLQQAGHDVRIITHPGFEPLVRERRLDFAPVAGDPREQADNRQLRDLHDNSRSFRKWRKTFNEVDAPLMRRRLADCWEACADADVVVASVLPCLFGYAVARKLDVPFVRAFYFPTSPTRSYPAEFVPSWLRLGGGFNLATYQLQRSLLWQIARPWMSRACKDILGLTSLPVSEPFGELDRQQQLLLYCYSPSVSPPPPDWSRSVHVTGYWFLDRQTDWSPPPALTAFLEEGPPPVYIGGFGSMTNREPKEISSAVLRALEMTGLRAIVNTGWGGLPADELPRGIFAADWVPFDWLYPRMSAVVHHGGCGTAAASFRAGVPAVIVPFFLDQFYWGRRVFEIGVGPRPILRKELNAGKLAAALKVATTDTGMRARAVELSARVSAENGVAGAVAAFTAHMRRGAQLPAGDLMTSDHAGP
jgi:UDP:flavonoid glycosyltransferase YjiC (YdhE family)